ncbi:RraA family protein [Streptomyces sp. YJ-C3]
MAGSRSPGRSAPPLCGHRRADRNPGHRREANRCGGVTVASGDVVVADEDGVVIVPAARGAEILADARAKLAQEASETLDAWETAHRAKVEAALHAGGFTG